MRRNSHARPRPIVHQDLPPPQLLRHRLPLRHIQNHPEFDINLRQLLHVSFKLAAKAGARYTDLLKAHEAVVARNVTENLYQRHFRPLFVA